MPRGALVVPIVLLASVGAIAFTRGRAAFRTAPPPEPAPAAEPAARPADPMPVSGRTPDDPPARTTSGRVLPSRNAARPPALGPMPAKVTILSFSDFTCPVCARSAAATRQIVEEWPGQVRIEFRTFAPPQHRYSEDVLVASLAAHRQGKFWEMHDVLFRHQGALEPSALPGYAREAGLDMERWSQDVADPALRQRVRAETAEAGRLGVGATPTFFVNGRRMTGWASWLVFRSAVETELTAVDGLVGRGVPLADVHAERARALAEDAAAFEAYRAAVLATPTS